MTCAKPPAPSFAFGSNAGNPAAPYSSSAEALPLSNVLARKMLTERCVFTAARASSPACSCWVVCARRAVSGTCIVPQ